MKKLIKDWFTIGKSDLFGDLLRIAFPFAFIYFIIEKIIT